MTSLCLLYPCCPLVGLLLRKMIRFIDVPETHKPHTSLQGFNAFTHGDLLLCTYANLQRHVTSRQLAFNAVIGEHVSEFKELFVETEKIREIREKDATRDSFQAYRNDRRTVGWLVGDMPFYDAEVPFCNSITSFCNSIMSFCNSIMSFCDSIMSICHYVIPSFIISFCYAILPFNYVVPLYHYIITLYHFAIHMRIDRMVKWYDGMAKWHNGIMTLI